MDVKKNVSFPRAGVTGGFEQRSMGAGNQTRILWRKRIPPQSSAMRHLSLRAKMSPRQDLQSSHSREEHLWRTTEPDCSGEVYPSQSSHSTG